jgi:hypothetical protein
MSTSKKRHESLQNKICKRIKIYAMLVSGIKRRRKGWKIFAHGKEIIKFIIWVELGLKIVPQGVGGGNNTRKKAEIVVTMASERRKSVDWIKKLCWN